MAVNIQDIIEGLHECKSYWQLASSIVKKSASKTEQIEAMCCVVQEVVDKL